MSGEEIWHEEAMKNSLVDKFQLLFLVIIAVSIFSCSKNDETRTTVLPEKLNSELHFRGFVTDEDEELLSKIHNFSKTVTMQDTVDGQPIWGYIANGKKVFFYTDDNGTVWEKNINDIGGRVVAYGFSYRDPLIIADWEILLRVDDGVGTEWETSVDTTFNAFTNSGETQVIRFIKNGKARYDGLSQTFLPESNKIVHALDAFWYELETHIVNQSTSDTLFSTVGSAHQYFLPEVGSVKYISNFTKTEKDQEDVKLLGTWELMRKEIPE